MNCPLCNNNQYSYFVNVGKYLCTKCDCEEIKQLSKDYFKRLEANHDKRSKN